MKYINAADILPEKLLRQLQTYIDGDVLYIPKASKKMEWGTVNGSRLFYQERNKEIQRLYKEGHSIGALAEKYNLAHSTIKKIIYGWLQDACCNGKRLFGNIDYNHSRYYYLYSGFVIIGNKITEEREKYETNYNETISAIIR